MKKLVICFILICLFLCGTAYAETAYVNGITADRVHLRSMPNVESASLGLFYTGTQLNIQSVVANKEWAKVKIGEIEGYMMRKYLQAEPPVSQARKALLKTKTLNMRMLPGKGSKVIKVLEQSDEVTVFGHIDTGFYYIQTNDLTGYVMEEYLNVTDETPSPTSNIRKVGQTFDGYFIYSWPAPNGQMLYFAGLEDPGITFDDVNFDGHEDVVITIIRGASNFFTEFFVWNNGEYVYAAHDGLSYGLCNYQLYPQYGIVHSGANNGRAGAEHEEVLFRWEGTNLRAIRRAVSDTYAETTDLPNGSGYTTILDTEKLRVRVWDYSKAVYEGELIYENVIHLDQLSSNDSYTRLFAGEQQALWQGIR